MVVQFSWNCWVPLITNLLPPRINKQSYKVLFSYVCIREYTKLRPQEPVKSNPGKLSPTNLKMIYIIKFK